MAYTFNGTTGPDDLDTQTIADALPYYTDGITINGLSGDDELYASVLEDGRIDELNGGDGDDTLGASLYSSSSGAILDGEDGIDFVFLPFNLGSIQKIENFGIKFSGNSYQGVPIDIIASYRNEILTDASGTIYLFEDLYRDRITGVSWDEAYARTYNGNNDWFFRGLDTYTAYHSPRPKEAPKQSLTTGSGVPNIEAATGRQIRGTNWEVPVGSPGKWLPVNKVKDGEYVWAMRGRGKKKKLWVDNDLKAYPTFNTKTDGLMAQGFIWENTLVLEAGGRPLSSRWFPGSTLLFEGSNIIAWFPNIPYDEFIQGSY